MTPTMKGERHVGGLWCSEVLAVLTRYLDGDLGADELDQVKAHVGGCSECAQFGDAFHKAIIALRRVDTDTDTDVDLSDRILTAID